MSRIDLHEKFNRSVRLLLGLRHLVIRRALAPYNLTDERIAEGWSLVTQAGLARIVSEPLGSIETSPKFPDPASELDAFQKFWFPIVRGVLAATYPEIGTAFFAGLAQERGAAVGFMAASFLDRLGSLARGDAIYGPDGPAARQLLTERGLSAFVVESLERALERWNEPYGEPNEDERTLAAERAAAAKLWAFYLEWSSIASKVLTNQTHLRWLGLGAPAAKPGKKAREKLPPSAEAPRNLAAGAATGPRYAALPHRSEAGGLAVSVRSPSQHSETSSSQTAAESERPRR